MSAASMPTHQRAVSDHLQTQIQQNLRQIITAEGVNIAQVSRLFNDLPVDNTYLDLIRTLLREAESLVALADLNTLGASWEHSEEEFNRAFKGLFARIDQTIVELLKQLHRFFLLPDGNGLQPTFVSDLSTAAGASIGITAWNDFVKNNHQEFIRQIHGAIFLYAAGIAGDVLTKDGIAGNSLAAFIARVFSNRIGCLGAAFEIYSTTPPEPATTFCCIPATPKPRYSVSFADLSDFAATAIGQQFDADPDRKIAVIDMCRVPMLPGSPVDHSTSNPMALSSPDGAGGAAASTGLTVQTALSGGVAAPVDFRSPRVGRTPPAAGSAALSADARALRAWSTSPFVRQDLSIRTIAISRLTSRLDSATAATRRAVAEPAAP